MSLDFSHTRLTPFKHQVEDTETLVASPWLFITSEMRTGKTKICIDGAQFLFIAGVIDRVLVVAPSPVRDVWYDPQIGELHKHLWEGMYARITEFHAVIREWRHAPKDAYGPFQQYASSPMQWMVTNYEFLRRKPRLTQLLPYCTNKTLMICDESSFIKNYDAEQTKACFTLRKACSRIIELNGTPISHSPLDLFSQGNLLHPSILQCKYITHYKSRYAVQEPVLGHGGKALLTKRGQAIQTITGWTNLEDIQRRFAPYVIRRLQKDCLDLPPKLDPVTLTADLTPETWKVYKNMRDELVVWLQNGNVATSPTAAIKVLRLAQITSGFIGGVEDANIHEVTVEDGLLDSLDLGIDYDASNRVGSSRHDEENPETIGTDQSETRISWVGREKLDVLLWFLGQRLDAEPNMHIVVWCRFRAELFRMLDEVAKVYPQFIVASICGGQKKSERQYAMQLLHPETTPRNTPVFVGGTYGTGSFGVNFTGANHSVNCSFDYSLGKFKQSADRVYGPGMIGPAAYFDIIARGPKGQKTIDHAIVAARRNADDIATWTTEAWITALTQE